MGTYTRRAFWTIFEHRRKQRHADHDFSNKDAAAKVQNLRPEDRQEIRKSHKLSRMEGEKVFFIEK